jgi:hypothetical protein
LSDNKNIIGLSSLEKGTLDFLRGKVFLIPEMIKGKVKRYG